MILRLKTGEYFSPLGRKRPYFSGFAASRFGKPILFQPTQRLLNLLRNDTRVFSDSASITPCIATIKQRSYDFWGSVSNEAKPFRSYSGRLKIDIRFDLLFDHGFNLFAHFSLKAGTFEPRDLVNICER